MDARLTREDPLTRKTTSVGSRASISRQLEERKKKKKMARKTHRIPSLHLRTCSKGNSRKKPSSFFRLSTLAPFLQRRRLGKHGSSTLGTLNRIVGRSWSSATPSGETGKTKKPREEGEVSGCTRELERSSVLARTDSRARNETLRRNTPETGS